MRNSTVYLNIPMQVRWAWLKAEEAEYNALMKQPGTAYHDHIYTTIQNDFSAQLKVVNTTMLLRLIKSLATTSFRADAPDDWAVSFNELYRAAKRFSFNDDEYTELSQFLDVPKRIDGNLSAGKWQVVTGISSDNLGRQERFIFIDMDATVPRKTEPTASCIQLWSGIADMNGILPSSDEPVANALVMAASKEMYAAIVAVMNSGVNLPDDIKAQLDSAFDKANGDYLYEIGN